MAMKTEFDYEGPHQGSRILKVGETYVLPAHKILRRLTPQSDITESSLLCDGYGIVREVFQQGGRRGVISCEKCQFSATGYLGPRNVITYPGYR